MRKKIVFVFVLALISCKKNEAEPVIKPVSDFLKTSDLYSKVFYISTKLNTENCTAYNDGCDCCDGKIIFLKNGTFVSDFYCIPDVSYTTGTFEVLDKKLILKYAAKEAVYGPSNEDYSEEEESVLRLADSKMSGITEVAILRCKEHYVFKNGSDYFSEDKKTSFQLAVNQYKRDGVWELLDIKE
ncbi:hypothetical protein [Flavobacterium sp. N1994]|uniref:hypothetical protein n=1 Tax=Flavobacterium sp. N1994 TaxID=2986827 RepID=UPI0022234C55|nr:hypothetical protein [Flavobacterium sp. N1994]